MRSLFGDGAGVAALAAHLHQENGKQRRGQRRQAGGEKRKDVTFHVENLRENEKGRVQRCGPARPLFGCFREGGRPRRRNSVLSAQTLSALVLITLNSFRSSLNLP